MDNGINSIDRKMMQAMNRRFKIEIKVTELSGGEAHPIAETTTYVEGENLHPRVVGHLSSFEVPQGMRRVPIGEEELCHS